MPDDSFDPEVLLEHDWSASRSSVAHPHKNFRRRGETPATTTTILRADAAVMQAAESWSPAERAALVEVLRRACKSPIDRLALLPASEVLTPAELRTLDAVMGTPPPTARSVHSSLVMIMKATRLCNLRCTYCHFWRDGPNQVMAFQVMATTIRDVLATPGVTKVEFTWHGGEVTLLRPAFLRKAIWLQELFRRPDQHVSNQVQTNGIRLDDEWLNTLRDYDVTVGVSLDGPPETHDLARMDRQGRATSEQVRAGLAKLAEAGIPHGVLMVVTQDVIDLGADRLLSFLLDLGVGTVGLCNVIPENATTLRGQYLAWSRYVSWLRELFALWSPSYSGRLVLRELADLAGKVAGGPSRTCLFAGDCHGRYLTVEPDGSVSACDKYVDDPGYVLGGSLREAMNSPRLAAIRQHESMVVDAMRDCRWFGVCSGGCPHDRRLTQRHDNAEDGCCGLAPLLDDMSGAIAGPAETPATKSFLTSPTNQRS